MYSYEDLSIPTSETDTQLIFTLEKPIIRVWNIDDNNTNDLNYTITNIDHDLED
jgi:hypothetical protein